jgi:hypothetical protein
VAWTLAIDAAWASLIGALGGVFLTSVFALITAILTRRWRESSRLEEWSHRVYREDVTLRRDAYVQLLSGLKKLGNDVNTRKPWDEREAQHFQTLGREEKIRYAENRVSAWRDEAPEIWDEADFALQQAKLVAGEDLFRTLEAHEDVLDQQLGVAAASRDPQKFGEAVSKELILAMRIDLAAKQLL